MNDMFLSVRHWILFLKESLLDVGFTLELSGTEQIEREILTLVE